MDYAKLDKIGVSSSELSTLTGVGNDSQSLTPKTKSTPLDILNTGLEIDLASELEALGKEEERLRKQILLFEKRKEVQNLKSSVEQSACGLTTAPAKDDIVTTATLAKDKDLEAALDLLKDCHLGEFINPDKLQDLSASARPNINAMNLHLIPDFVTRPTSSSFRGDRESIKRVEEVTPAQWVSANSKILIKLLGEGLDQQGIWAYLRYSSKIGDYLQVSKPYSVMLLDHEHRKQVHEENRAWDNIDGDKVYFYLKSSDKHDRPDTHRFDRKEQATDPAGRVICLRYNGHTGCHLTYCRFSHVCMICHGNHPRMQHHNPQQAEGGPQNAGAQNAGPPRFRPQI